MPEQPGSMSESPLLKRTRARFARQRELEKQRWEIQPAVLQKSMIRWILRIIALMILFGLLFLRTTGRQLF
jgi:hypothetical protein